ncbi:MAG: hypothetical protein AAGA09_07545 [Pseudomonadota bacterium]
MPSLRSGGIATGLAGAVLCALLSLPGAAFAHAGHQEGVRIFIGKKDVRVRAQLPAHAFLAFDTNKDGDLSVGEFNTQFEKILAFAEARFMALDATGGGVSPVMSDMRIEGIDHMAPDAALLHVVIDRRYKREGQRPTAMALQFPGAGALMPYALHSTANAIAGAATRGTVSLSGGIVHFP